MSHKPSDYIISKIKEFEGCILKSYYCPGGVLTIGYGITNSDYNNKNKNNRKYDNYS